VCPDSNLALEKGLILNNPFAPVEEGKEVFISLQNTSGSRVFINNDEIIARLVLNPVL
jgi:dUTPase